MKRIQVLSIALLLLVSSTVASAQTPVQPLAQIPAQPLAQTPAKVGAIPENGFWEVITNNSAPDLTIVKFYDLDKHLIYEEHLTGVRLDLTRTRTCRRLNQSLQSALVAYDENKQLLKDKGFVAAHF